MERHLGHLRLFPGTESEFDRRHAAIPHELAEAIRSSGFRNVTSFRRGTDVWVYLEADPHVSVCLASLLEDSTARLWIHGLRVVVADGLDRVVSPRSYSQVFHSHGPELGSRFERGLFSMVVDPERAAVYDQLHAHPWPDMIAALAESGFRNYTGFRRGAHVVYYGEFHPNMGRAFAAIGRTEVNTRWGAAFDGVIATIADGDGELISARETFHLD